MLLEMAAQILYAAIEAIGLHFPHKPKRDVAIAGSLLVVLIGLFAIVLFSF